MTDVDCVSLLGRPGAPAPYDARYILRPETVESLFIAYRLSGDEKYRRYGWKIFQAIETHCKIESGGYASIINVDQVPAEFEDKMETFLMVRPQPIAIVAPHTRLGEGYADGCPWRGCRARR